MNKKWMLMGTGLTLGSALFVTSAFAGVGESAGYDAYKSAIKTTVSAQNVTKKVSVSVKDNGNRLLDVASTIKSDSSSHAASANVDVKAGTASDSAAFYMQDGKGIVKPGASDVYSVVDMAKGRGWHESKQADKAPFDSNFAQERENVIDALVGNLKDHVSLAKGADGTKNISLQLNGSQIPAVANAVSSLVIKGAANGHHPGQGKDAAMEHNPFGNELEQLKNSLPKLTQDIQIKQVNLNAAVDAQNRITNQTVTLAISGKDGQGAAHDIVIDASIGLSAFNETTPDKVDLTGKQVQTIEKQSGPHKGPWNER